MFLRVQAFFEVPHQSGYYCGILQMPNTFSGLGLLAQADLHLGLSGVHTVDMRIPASPGDAGPGLVLLPMSECRGRGAEGQELCVWG